MLPSKEMRMRQLALKLFEINAIKFGDFKMKVGLNSPIYFDLRVIVSYPDVMELVANVLIDYIKEHNLNAQHVCGVPYTALPLATLVAVQQRVPMLIRRKETKTYGTKKLIEGIYSKGDSCLIIEDVVTSGSSVLETVRDLNAEGLIVTDAVVMVDREQGGAENISKNGLRMHSLFTLSFLLRILLEEDKILKDTLESVAKYIAKHQINSVGGSTSIANSQSTNNFSAELRMKMKFEKRADLAKNSVGNELFKLMATKKTNLCLAADLKRCDEILNVADKCGPYICLLKTHIDIVEDFSESFINNLKSLANKHQFLLMEDRKYADIGNTVALQYGGGIYKVATWADLVTAHSITGRSILQGLKAGIFDVDSLKKRGVFLLGEMSAQGNLIDDKYAEATNRIATEGPDVDFVCGIVGQCSDHLTYPGLIQLTPGVRIDESGDTLGQQYQTPEYVVKEKGADIAVVGRGILLANSIEQAAILYRDRLWSAYVDRTTN